ncbi:hypothetical protein GGI04_002284 [Coemansia thaxteri]|uniref:Uncharacterized protein n=1 Tax=Coemansia thaxteri TaxID=2663907 RepID=A0A9W8EE46_9FUNG|nr:hypothetical protein H4R26_004331 [Coemansia thaxteri]KAJ2005345.1 hypothetical protein GGI04_002284 [Coemansia thaxteri]KAJ2472096.1 hypothetical protein GGI02_001826 [Coemansia sp. RSA 2322]KAJ2479630.1 hypothetical protein EV174_003963 [Coemansia sp. RSA 2320]
MSHNSHNSAPRAKEEQGTPIPIGVPGSQRPGGGYLGREGATGRQTESEARFQPESADFVGSQVTMRGIEAPPNSLVMQSSMTGHFSQSPFSSMRPTPGGGSNPPPNTPAQASKLQQMMAAAGGDVPTHSFVCRRTCGMDDVSETDEHENEAMDQDMEDEFSPSCSNPSSFRHDSRHMTNDESEDMFKMD